MIPIKSAREIEKMRQACRTASDILDRVSELVRPGITTKEVDEAAAVFMQEANVKSAFLGYRLGHRVFHGKALASAISARRLRTKPGATAFQSYVSLSVTVWAASCTKNLKSLITADAAADRN